MWYAGISGDESNALVMRSTGRRQTDVRKNGYKGNFLHLVLATMLDVFGDSVQDGCQKKASECFKFICF